MSEHDNQLIHYSELTFTIKHAHNAIYADRFHCIACLLAHKVLRANMAEFRLQFLATIDSFCHVLNLIRANDCLNATTIPLHDVFVMPVTHCYSLYPDLETATAIMMNATKTRLAISSNVAPVISSPIPI